MQLPFIHITLARMNIFLALISTAILSEYTVVCSSQQDNDLVVLTTASRLKEAIRSQLDQALTEYLPEFCSQISQDHSSANEPSPTLNNPQLCAQSTDNVDIDNITAAVQEAVNETQAPLLSYISQLLAPGTPCNRASSCKEIYNHHAPPSGFYWLRGWDIPVYCDMEKNCKGLSGGWMRLAKIDMSDPNSVCPHGLKTIVEDGHTLCAVNKQDRGCSSAMF